VIGSKALNRRDLLRVAVGAGGALALANPYARALAGTRATTAQTLDLFGWGFRADLVHQSLRQFKSLYGRTADFVNAPGAAFEPYIETRFIAHQHVDSVYTQIPFLNKWARANWLVDVTHMPGAQAQLKAMYPQARPAFLDYKGRMTGLPYFYSFYLFGYNKDHLDRANLTPPKTWPELIDQAQKLKADGISQYPYIGFWTTELGGLNQQFFCDCFAEGDPVFDKDGNPTFAHGSGVVGTVLQRYKQLYDQQLTPPDALTVTAPGPVFATGNVSFFTADSYNHRPTSGDATFSKVAGKEGFALYPGKTHTVFAGGVAYTIGADTVDKEGAWNLMQFLGGKAKDGRYHHITKWILAAGLSNPYPAVMESPAVVRSLKTWVDINVWNAQARRTQTRTIEKALWFADFDTYFPGTIQDYILGKTSLNDLLNGWLSQIKKLKKAYGG
jgi:multiple sugar transport system substrate-binding protein